MLEKPDTIIKVLRFIERRGGQVHVRELARHLWPQSPLWTKRAKTRNESGLHEPGARLHTAAACLCGRLAREGLTQRLSKGIFAITERGRQYLSAPPAPIVPAASLPQWRWGWVFWPDAKWYPALVGRAEGSVCPILFNDGRFFWVDSQSVAYADAAVGGGMR